MNNEITGVGKSGDLIKHSELKSSSNANNHDDIDNLFNKVNFCITEFGEDHLKNMLSNMIYDHEQLNERQNIIKNLCLNPKKVSKIRKLLKKIKKNQNLVDNWLYDFLDPNLFSSYELLNTHYGLDIFNKIKYSSVIITLMIYIVVYVYLSYTGKCLSFYDYLCGLYVANVENISWLISFVISHEDYLYYLSHLLGLLYVIYSFINYYQLSRSCLSQYNRCEEFKNDFNKINTMIDQFEEIIKLDVINCDHLENKIVELKKIFSPQFKLGDYLIIQYNRDKYLDDFKQITDYIGSIDAYISISHLLTQNYSLPFFIESDEPTCYISQIWNPLIDYEMNIKNDFSPINKRLTLITGPNKAGKSTYMRSIYTALYLTQTIGVSPCEQIILTPYKYLFTYLNIPDIIGRESLFEAELNRIYEYYTFIKSLHKNEFAFSIIDELFTGTNPKEGQATSNAFCKFLSVNENTINVVSTHFPNNLGNEVSYCKFSAQYDQNKDKYTFDYKMMEGVSDQHIAIELLKEKGYDKTIVEEANNILKLL